MSQPTDLHVSARIASIRRDKGFTQRECAARTGLKISQIQRIEQTGNLYASELVKLSRVLGKNPGWFMRPPLELVQTPANWDASDGGPVLDDLTNPGSDQ